MPCFMRPAVVDQTHIFASRPVRGRQTIVYQASVFSKSKNAVVFPVPVARTAPQQGNEHWAQFFATADMPRGHGIERIDLWDRPGFFNRLWALFEQLDLPHFCKPTSPPKTPRWLMPHERMSLYGTRAHFSTAYVVTTIDGLDALDTQFADDPEFFVTPEMGSVSMGSVPAPSTRLPDVLRRFHPDDAFVVCEFEAGSVTLLPFAFSFPTRCAAPFIPTLRHGEAPSAYGGLTRGIHATYAQAPSSPSDRMIGGGRLLFSSGRNEGRCATGLRSSI